MRKLSFEPYIVGDSKLSISARRYLLLYQAVYNPNIKAGDDKETRRFGKVLDLIDLLAEKNDDRVSMKSNGGEIIFEDAEYDLLKAAWIEFRKNLPRALAREISDLDDFVNNSQEFRPSA